MTSLLPPLVIAAALAGAVLGLVHVLFDRAPGRVLLVVLVVVEALAVLQAVTAVVLVAQGERPVEGTGTFGAYTVASVLAVPAGTVWAWSERSRSGTGVLVVACLAAAVIVVRMDQVWSGAGG